MRMPMSRNAMLIIAAGMYLALGAIAGYATVNAVVLILIAMDRYRWDRSRLSFVIIAICILVLIVNQFALFALVVLISLGIYYLRAKPPAVGTYVSKHQLFLNMRWNEQSWVLHSMSFWHAFGEVRMDMTLAVPEDRQLTIVLQGIAGNVDVIVPDDYGLEVEASVLLGQISFKDTKEGGMFHRFSWKSPDFDNRETQLKLQLFYLVGDIKIRTI
ncbi:cell wall-active antibiotics response protein LiaF [Cohnella panacarvi]|uniref:cell wall-active antibiotics response protein LiaF n=1 Tax=Cohnella panacarvi TaxID=400776 RepID=UPI00047DD69B|nr:cell wall-active antibiotics response protein LiaF [Cohnella panacarvi]